MRARLRTLLPLILVAAQCLGCGGGSDSTSPSPPSATTPPAPPAAPAAVASVVVTLDAATLLQGGTATGTATLHDASGNVLTDRTVTWQSSDATVARVEAGGRITAVGLGHATVSATSEGQTGQAPIAVTHGSRGSLLVAVDPGLKSGIAARLDRFIADLARDGFRAVLHDISESTPAQLRETIKGYHARLSPALDGVVFIGRVPIPHATFEYSAGLFYRGQSMQYFMDLDGEFAYRGGPVATEIDSHTGAVEIEIWTSILPYYGGVANTVALINDYLDKNHAYRQGLIAVQRGFANPVLGSRISTAELYAHQYAIIRDEYFVSLNRRGNFFVGIDSTLGDPVNYPTSRITYERELLTDRYDVASIGAHGSTTSFGSDSEYGSIVIDLTYARTQAIKPVFLLEHSCSTAAIEFFPNLATEFLYNRLNNVLAFGGATAPQGGMGITAAGTPSNVQADALVRGASIGQAYFAPMRSAYVGPQATFREGLAAQQILLGDGTLRLQEFMAAAR